MRRHIFVEKTRREKWKGLTLTFGQTWGLNLFTLSSRQTLLSIQSLTRFPGTTVCPQRCLCPKYMMEEHKLLVPEDCRVGKSNLCLRVRHNKSLLGIRFFHSSL